MYTRCPSCRAEICFEPPANAANLPDGYKHRIKCPSCGVTIGVKLPNRDAIASVQPTFTPANPNAFSSEPIYSAAPYTPSAEDEKAAKKEARKAAAATKKSGLSRNITVFVFSALFIVCAVLGYLYTQGTVDNGILSGFAYFDGVSVLKSIAQEPELYQAMFEADLASGFISVLPVIFFLGALLTAALALVCMFAKKYFRIPNLILGLGMLVVAVCILCAPALTGDATSEELTDYLSTIIENGAYLIVVPVVIGVLHSIASLIFLKSMKKKVA